MESKDLAARWLWGGRKGAREVGTEEERLGRKECIEKERRKDYGGKRY